MKLIVPRALRFGDSIGIIAPASPPKDPALIDTAVRSLKKLGFEVMLGKAVRKKKGYLAGDDSDRLKDLHRMFADKHVTAIMCLRGGYGSPRLLSKMDFALIRNNPKIFCGFSDITALHMAIFSKTGLVTFHGPNLLGLMNKKDISEYTIASWLRSVMVNRAAGSIANGMPTKSHCKTIMKGTSTGTLIGGNLSLINALIGTPYLPSFEGKILFMEDVNEAPYKLDRLLTQLDNAGLLKKLKGIAFGTFTGEGDFFAVCKERILSLKIPSVYGLPFGHIDHFATLPHGAQARLDATKGTLEIIQAAVR